MMQRALLQRALLQRALVLVPRHPPHLLVGLDSGSRVSLSIQEKIVVRAPYVLFSIIRYCMRIMAEDDVIEQGMEVCMFAA